ncbi:GumC family protein [Mucilaginibacter sp.]
MSQASENIPLQNTDEDLIDIKGILAKIISNWILFLISVVFCLALAVLYVKYASREWHVSSKILVEDEKNGGSSAISGDLNSDISSVFNVKSSADNEVQILKSRSLMTNVVKLMNLNIRTFNKSNLKAIEIYQDAPFTVSIQYKADTLLQRNYTIKIIDKNRFEISNSDDDVNLKGSFGQPVKLRQYNITLQKTNLFAPRGIYGISIESVDAAIDEFSQVFSATLSDKQSTTIDLSFSYPQPDKGEAILNALMKQYLLSNLQNKVEIADSTMAFINKEIDIVFNGLNGTEKQFEQYKEENNIADIVEQSKALITNSSDYNDKLSQENIQLSVVDNLEKILNNPNNKQIIPSGLVINNADPSFGQSIDSYNQLVLERDKASLSYTDSNPVIQNYNSQLATSRVNLLRTLNAYRNSLLVAKNQLDKQNGTFNGQLKEMPSKQRVYLDFQRQQQLKQELYLFLLQKREETAISKTSTISSSRIIDYAKSDFSPFKPKGSLIYLVGLLVGLIIPGAYLAIKELLNIRINTKADIEKLTSISIIGEISHNKDGNSLIVTNNSRSVISEQFRSLRTNLQYALNSSKSNVLLFTSSMSGEGKSFLSLNLGSALALTDKKVIFMELDLRKPKLSENMGLDNSDGFTNYIVSDSMDFKRIIKPTWFSKNCFIISSGPIPPNPSELLINGKLEQLINELKKEYDFIIMDCAPIGLVTDALLLERFADVTFYVVRQNYTYKSQLNIANDIKNNKKVKNLYLLVNDIKAQGGGYSSYGQGYGYGYGYGEYNNNNDKQDIFYKKWVKRS